MDDVSENCDDVVVKLDTAQRVKLYSIVRSIEWGPGERFLYIVCGYGTVVMRADKRLGAIATGITLSTRQADEARRRIAEANLEACANIELRDYRELETGAYDKIVSIGMFEHVGRSRLPEYFKTAFGLLRAGGLFLNHGIAQQDLRKAGRASGFMARFVFPDGVPLPLSRIELALERAGFVTRHVEGLPEDYAETLRHWIERFDSHYEQAVRLAGIERARIWRLYLRAARLGFQTGWASIYQVLAQLPPSTSRQGASSIVGLGSPTRERAWAYLSR